MKIVIIGGGVIGLSCAYYLQKTGCDITVIDKGDLLDGCSYGNAGYVCPSHFTPLASSGMIAQGVRWMLRSSSPFYVKPRFDLDLFRWGINFWRAATKPTVEKNSHSVFGLLKLSRHLTTEMKHDLRETFFMEEKGIIMLYKNADTEKHELELAQKASDFGLATTVLSAEEVQMLEPNVKVNVRGGVLYPGDAHLNPAEFMTALKKHLLKNGVSFQAHTTVESFEKRNKKVTAVVTNKGGIDCDELLVAAGSWLPGLTKMLSIQLPLQAGKGYSMTFQGLTRNLQFPSILVDDRVAMTPLQSQLRIGGTMEIAGINNNVRIKRAEAIFDAAKKCYPDLPIQFPGKGGVWTGLRPLSPDGLPYIGRAKKYDNVVVAGGHAMLGVSLAAATGKLVSQLIHREPLTLSINSFEIERFN